MDKRWTVLVAFLFSCASLFQAQVSSSTQDFIFQVSNAQPWTDTGLDLVSGDAVRISAGGASASAAGAPPCDPKTASGTGANLPLPSAPAGALIAHLHAQGAVPLLVGTGAELKIEEASHLFLGLNLSGTLRCQTSLTVNVHRIPAGAIDTGAAGTSSSQEKTRGEQLKSQLSTAAQVFMSGQFGLGKSESTTNSASSNAGSSGSSSGADPGTAVPPLKVSEAALDVDLRKSLDGLPRRVNDQFKNLGDMVNFVIVGSQKDVQAALDAATWHVADTNNERAALNAVMETYENKDYLQMPMSTLYLFGRKQDFGYEMAEPIAMVASRHHFRIWKAPFTWKGQEVWVGAGTHDIGFAKDKRNGNVTHKIDPGVDGERDNIGSSLQKASKTKTVSYYLPPNPVQEAKNATGDGYHSDGRLLVILLP
jgi:hypothetical protein